MNARSRRTAPLAVGGLLLGFAGLDLHAQPVGSEFRVNAGTTGRQYRASVASGPSGNFVVVWTGYGYPQDDSGFGVFGQRFGSSGAPIGSEFRVNTLTAGKQYRGQVASDSSGNFVVAWGGAGQDGSGYGVFGQRFGSSGAPLGPEFRVNTFSTGNQYGPSVASDSSGNLVIAWSSSGQDGSDTGVFGQRFGSSGEPLGPEFRVNTYTTKTQYSSSIASDSSGNFVVAWTSQGDGSTYGVFGQRFASSGAPLGSEFRVNTFTTGNQYVPSVASDSSGNFVVAWSVAGVFGQRFGSSGAPLGSEFRVNTDTIGSPYLPSVASDASGNFVVAWQSFGQDGSNWGAFGQRFGSSGAPLGSEFRVNTYTTGTQYRPSVASSAGDVVVAWSSFGQDGSLGGVFGQRFAPSALAGDVDGNGQVNVTDVLYLINYLFAAGPAPLGDADANGDHSVNVTDVLYLINYLFAGGAAPV